MAITRVLGRGQITLPREVRRQARLRPGDVLSVQVVGPGELRVTVLPRLGPDELRERYPIVAPIDEPTDRAAWQDVAARDVVRE